MTVQDAIGWFQSKLLVNNRFGLHGNQDEAARLALIALIEQKERLQNRSPARDEPKIMAGDPAWVINRDVDEGPYDVSGYMFVAEVGDYVILSPYYSGVGGINEALAENAENTAMQDKTDLPVFPAKDCFATKEEARAALKAQRGW